ncbi:MAG: DUF1559 domain-containing protein [Verrucomicrobiae bacterium]|nr:DUF1559 domain-containing protein [Verrucomicrobiae bacterium]
MNENTGSKQRDVHGVEDDRPDGRRTMGVPWGFTLVELLVAVSILMLLMGLLFGALKGVRERGRQIQCMNNLKQLSLAMTSYAEENDGFLPLYRASSTSPYVRWFDAMYKYYGMPKILKCPSDKTPDGPASFPENASSSQRLGCSYGINWYVSGTGNPHRCDEVQRLADFLLIADGAYWSYIDRTTLVCEGEPAASGVEPRHGGRFNVLWLDGHVSSEENLKNSNIYP